MKVGRSTSAVILLGLGASMFFLGRALRPRSAADEASAEETASGTPAGLGAPTPGKIRPSMGPATLSPLGEALALGAAAARRPDGGAALESPAARDERHRLIGQLIDRALPGVSPEKKVAIMAWNDDLILSQDSMLEQLKQGSLSNADYLHQYESLMDEHLRELQSLVTPDEYRQLTGLEPGVNPDDVIRTGGQGMADGVNTISPTSLLGLQAPPPPAQKE